MATAIAGEFADDNFGWDVALNAAGDRLVVGATSSVTPVTAANSGQVRVYAYDSGVWVQLGADLDGQAADDRFGWSVDMNAKGDRIVVGSIYNDGNGSNSGQVRIYELVNGNWVQLGAAIDGELGGDEFGNSVAINDLGDKIVSGARFNDGFGSNSGHVRVYEYTGATWSQVGADINGRTTNSWFGWSVDINAAGDKIVASAPNDFGQAGYTSVYSYTAGKWRQEGQDIIGESGSDRSGQGEGSAVSMNDLGDRIAIGAHLNDGNGSNSGQVRIYGLESNSWNQLGFDVDGETANDRLGYSVAMNGVGDRIAAGAWNNVGGAANAGHVRVYETPVICPLPMAIILQQDEDPTFSYGSSSYCSVESDPTPVITGTLGGTFTSTSGLVINSSTGVIDLDASTPGVYAATYTTPGTTAGGCVGFMSQTIRVESNTTDFTYGATAFCVNDTNPKATITGVVDGIFSSATGLVIDPITGTINLSASTPGNYDVTYTPPYNFNQLGADIDGTSSGDQFWILSRCK